MKYKIERTLLDNLDEKLPKIELITIDSSSIITRPDLRYDKRVES